MWVKAKFVGRQKDDDDDTKFVLKQFILSCLKNHEEGKTLSQN